MAETKKAKTSNNFYEIRPQRSADGLDGGAQQWIYACPCLATAPTS